MKNYVTNIDHDQVLTVLKIKRHVYCFNPRTIHIYDVDINNVNELLTIDDVVFFIVNSVKE